MLLERKTQQITIQNDGILCNQSKFLISRDGITDSVDYEIITSDIWFYSDKLISPPSGYDVKVIKSMSLEVDKECHIIINQLDENPIMLKPNKVYNIGYYEPDVMSLIIKESDITFYFVGSI